jgi:cysteine sulfinate desulfinase/cysteine desulfurase-like protein
VDWAMGAVRCSLGRSTTAEDVDYVIDCLETVVGKLRRLLPTGSL